MTQFNFEETQLKVLANFATINPQMLIEPDKFSVISPSKSVLANYKFTTPFNFESFGLYNTSDFLSVLSAMKKAQIDVKDKLLYITSDSDKLTYYTSAKELVPKVPDTDSVFNSLIYDIDISLPADRLAIALKMSPLLKAEYMFFETDNKRVKITIGSELESSQNSFEILVEDGIKINQLSEPVRIALADFKVLPGEYKVGIAKKEVKGKFKYFSRWENLNGVTYFIATEALAK